MKNKFIQGDLVKSTARTAEYPLFLMVLHDTNPCMHNFKAVIIKDVAHYNYRTDCECDKSERECFCNYESKPGYAPDNWNTQSFELCTWEEIKKYI